MRVVPAAMLALSLTSAAASGAPRELGAVRFGRDLGTALAVSARSGRPVLLLFQEIPGCATCTSFGDGPLSHPLLVEAIESEFEPVAIHNNRPGADAEVLARYREPAWNNPVMRFVDARGRDVVPRRDGLYGTHEIAARLVEALRAARRPVPAYLAAVAAETNGARERVTFGMHCFWEGQARLGALDGVVSARPVFADGSEAVEVEFDPARVPLERLVRAADGASCARRVWAADAESRRTASRVVGDRATTAGTRPRPAPPDDDLRSLARSPLRWVPLTRLQALRVNAALASGAPPDAWLSPRQLALHAGIVAALARDPRALDGLERPDDSAELGTYAARLGARLAGGRARG